MTTYDRNRLSGYNYSHPGWYFITICTWQKIHWFGHVQHNRMCVNAFGAIVFQQLMWLQHTYPYITIDSWIIMPNHVHVLIQYNTHYMQRIASVSVRTGRDLSLHQTNNGQIKKSIPSLIGAFKTTSSKLIRQRDINFRWQRSYHDRIIRSHRELQNVGRYILENPRDYKN